MQASKLQQAKQVAEEQLHKAQTEASGLQDQLQAVQLAAAQSQAKRVEAAAAEKKQLQLRVHDLELEAQSHAARLDQAQQSLRWELESAQVLYLQAATTHQ